MISLKLSDEGLTNKPKAHKQPFHCGKRIPDVISHNYISPTADSSSHTITLYGYSSWQDNSHSQFLNFQSGQPGPGEMVPLSENILR